jgi:ElaB/YqjD/DUF883 family membrane-anchored ribosome-binding protein
MNQENETMAADSQAFEEFKERLEGRDWQKTLDNAKIYIQTNPLKAVLIGAAAGFLVGYLVRRTKD